MEFRDEEKIMRAESIEELFPIPLDEQNSEKNEKISFQLNHEDAIELAKALQQNANIFSWSTADMLGISLKVITHQLNASSSYLPMK